GAGGRGGHGGYAGGGHHDHHRHPYGDPYRHGTSYLYYLIHGRYGSYYGDPYYAGYRYSPIGLYFGFSSYYPYDYCYGYYAPPAPVVVAAGAEPYEQGVGALDLNVKPKKTEIFLNGYSIGTADDFDGYPSLLWLEEGEYEVIFYLEGYETVKRVYYVRAGNEINVRFTMQPGASTPPQELSYRFTTSEPPPQEPAYAAPPPAGGPPGPATGEPPPLDARSAPGLVFLTVEPASASIYLDGRFIGTGDELSGRRGTLFVDAGEHLLEIVHPGYAPRQLQFTVEPGGELALDVPPLEPLGNSGP
ncbi:MAG: PEGA domain-containing protein, partial [Acidobacteria bacterium]